MNRKINKTIITALVCIFVIGLSSCSNKELLYEQLADHKKVEEDSTYGKINIKFDTLDGEDVRAFSTKPGVLYKFTENS